MGYPVQAGAPEVTLPNGRRFAVGAFVWSNIAGSFNIVGIFEDVPENGSESWNLRGYAAQYSNAGDMLRDIQAKGGRVKYLSWLIAAINKCFADLFNVAPPPPPPPDAEPSTDEEAMAMVAAAVNGMKLTLVNGVPTLSS